MIENARYGDEEKTSINAVINGERLSIPAVPGNRHYQMILDWQAEDPRRRIADYVPPPANNTPSLEQRLAALETEVEELRARS